MFRTGISILVAFIVMSLFAGTTVAQEVAAEEDPGPWTGFASLGFLSTSGNTDTESYNAAFGVTYTQDKWTHSFDASALGAETLGITTADAIQAGWKSTYDFSEFNYLFGVVNWRKDEFSGVEKQLTEALGYGRRLINTGEHILNAEVGVGHRSADLSDGTSESGVIGRGGLDYHWNFSETAAFEQLVSVETGSDNTYISSTSLVRAKLLGDLSLVFSYTLINNSDVPIGTEKTDKYTALSLEYAF